jgi:hypothetical protein
MAISIIKRLVRSTSLLCLTLLSSGVLADSTVTITLQGLVDITCFSTFQTAGEGQNLNLTLDTNDELVADGTLYCNDPNGYNVSLTSKNGQAQSVNSGLFLALTTDPVPNRLPYDLKFELNDGTSTVVTFVNGVATSQVAGSAGSAINRTFQVLISYVGNTSLAADSYTDELTLSIAAP